MRNPPFGRALTERIRFGNYPDHVVVCIGLYAWERAERWNNCPNDVVAMVMPSANDQFSWPVKDQLVVLETGAGPTDEQIKNLVVTLIHSGALAVTVIGSHPFKQYIPSHREAA